jgi:hypothetical protein
MCGLYLSAFLREYLYTRVMIDGGNVDFQIRRAIMNTFSSGLIILRLI